MPGMDLYRIGIGLHAGHRSLLGVRIRFFFDLVSYIDVRVQSNPYLLKETSVY